MRRLLFLFFLVLAACGGSDGQGTRVVLDPEPLPQAALHEPRILGVALLQHSALYMEGDGQVAVTAVLEVEDDGADIETLWIHMPNDVVLNFDVSGLVNGTTGTITQEFDVATTEVGYVDISFYLVDAAGWSSGSADADWFMVKGDPFTWFQRAADLPNALNDVSSVPVPGMGMGYGGVIYVAVGDAGTILTSGDGFTWYAQDSGTDVDLNAVSCNPGFWPTCLVAGDSGTILLSNSFDHSEWELYHDGPDDLSLQAIYRVDGWEEPFAGMILAGGTVETTDTACILHENFDEQPWSEIEPTAQSGHHITSIDAIQIGDPGYQFVATLEVPSQEQGRVLVSADGLTWVEVFISDGHESTYSQENFGPVWAGGSGGRIYSSPDGVNWTRYETPAVQSRLVAMTAGDSMLMAHGFIPSIGLGEQVGVATSDDGQTWQSFVIGTAYEPRGLAYGEGRWISVGQSLAEPGKGAIFTTQ